MENEVLYPDTPAPAAPSATDRHPLGVGDVHDRLIALEMWVKSLVSEHAKLSVQVSAMAASGTDAAESPAED